MQRYRAVILIVLFGVVPVVAAFFAALYFLKDEAANPAEANAVPVVAEAPPAPDPPENRKVLAAARALPVGTLIGEEDLTILALDLEAVRKGHILVEDEGEDKDEAADVLRGYAVRESLRSGEALVWSSVVGPGQRGFLAAVLGPGTRAVTIRVGPATSHAGLIDPGDRVDVILSAELQATERERTVLARTIVEDVRVVAVDRRVGNGAESSGGDAGSPGDAAGAGRTEMITATLEVSPAQGDRLVLGEHEGKLSLAVRSLAAAAPRTSDAAVELRDLLLSPESVDASALEERMREELALMEERLRAEEEERLRAVEEERLRLEEEERLRLAEGKRLRAAVEEERLRLEKKLALMEKRLQAEEEERLRAAEEERLRLAEEERLRLAEEERLRAQEEERLRLEKEERLRLAEEERLRLGKKLALMEKRLQAEEEERLRAADEERLRLEEEKRLRLAEEERLRAEEEERLRLEKEERLRLAEEERLRLEKELALMEKRLQAEEEERLRAAEDERLRLEEEERLRLVEEERLRAQEEERLRLEKEERLRLAEEERLRLEKELAMMQERLQSETKADEPKPETDGPPIRTVRVFRGSKPAEETLFGEAQ